MGLPAKNSSRPLLYVIRKINNISASHRDGGLVLLGQDVFKIKIQCHIIRLNPRVTNPSDPEVSQPP